MKAIQCEAKVLPDGHLILPGEIAEQIKPKRDTKTTRRIIILNEKTQPHNLSRFCGKWQDDRDADEIIAEIMVDRNSNVRSDKINL
jgi:hypothetical protein